MTLKLIENIYDQRSATEPENSDSSNLPDDHNISQIDISKQLNIIFNQLDHISSAFLEFDTYFRSEFELLENRTQGLPEINFNTGNENPITEYNLFLSKLKSNCEIFVNTQNKLFESVSEQSKNSCDNIVKSLTSISAETIKYGNSFKELSYKLSSKSNEINGYHDKLSFLFNNIDSLLSSSDNLNKMLQSINCSLYDINKWKESFISDFNSILINHLNILKFYFLALIIFVSLFGIVIKRFL